MRLRLPRRTVRLRLTVIYASLFLASGTGLLAITYVLVRHATDSTFAVKLGNGQQVFVSGTSSRPKPQAFQRGFSISTRAGPDGPPPGLTPQRLEQQARQLQSLAVAQHNTELRQLLEKSGIALAWMSALSIFLGWLAAGRALRPLRTLNERAREITATSLHKRLALTGPDDEVKQLANTFDDLLGRLDAAFQAQRQFVANASHELRTPLARAQTLAEVALADPEASVPSLKASHERVLAAGRQQEQLIEALLTLARSERGLDRREPFDLAEIATALLAARRAEIAERGLTVETDLAPADATGDPRLAERLVANLIDNALRHNRDGGRVEISTAAEGDRVTLAIANSGPRIDPTDVERLFQPFQRLGADRTDHGDGVGLGLSIVNAITSAHGATLAAQARPEGGLAVQITFPIS